MDNKRVHSPIYDHARTKSKKSRICTENECGTSSSYMTDSEQASVPTIYVNIGNLQKQISGVPTSWFDNYAAGQNSSNQPNRSSVITSRHQQESGYNYNHYFCDRDDVPIDYTISKTRSDESIKPTVITSVKQQASKHNYSNHYTPGDEEMNGIRSKINTCSYVTKDIACNHDLSGYHLDEELRISNNIGTVKHPNLFQYSDDELDNFVVSSYSNNGMACNSDVPSKYYSENGVRITDNIGTTRHTDTSHFHEDENLNITSSADKSRGTTVITSVREQESGCSIHLTEYDEAMNEIRSEVYKIVKAIEPSWERKITPLTVISTSLHLEGCNGECMQQFSTSRGHNNDSPAVMYSLIRDHVSSGDEEIHPKRFTKL